MVITRPIPKNSISKSPFKIPSFRNLPTKRNQFRPIPPLRSRKPSKKVADFDKLLQEMDSNQREHGQDTLDTNVPRTKQSDKEEMDCDSDSGITPSANVSKPSSASSGFGKASNNRTPLAKEQEAIDAMTDEEYMKYKESL